MDSDTILKKYNYSIYCRHVKSNSLANEHMLIRICSGDYNSALK